MDRWYVLFSKPRREFQVRDQLLLREMEVYLPLLPLRKSVHQAQQSRTGTRPLFPRYLFARFDASQTSPSDVGWTPGLTGFVRLAGELATVGDEVIEHIRNRLSEIRTQTPAPFHRGQRVRLPKDHPLAPLDAVFEKPLSDGQRAYILIEALGRLIRCEVDMNDLEAADTAAFAL